MPRWEFVRLALNQTSSKISSELFEKHMEYPEWSLPESGARYFHPAAWSTVFEGGQIEINNLRISDAQGLYLCKPVF